MKKFRRNKFLCALIFLTVCAAGIAIVMLLWNALIPTIIGWTTINYWQAAGLMILSRLLFGGFGRFGRHGGRGFGRRHRKEDFSHWHEMKEVMKDMTKEERLEYIRKHMREHQGFGGHPFAARGAKPENDTTKDGE